MNELHKLEGRIEELEEKVRLLEKKVKELEKLPGMKRSVSRPYVSKEEYEKRKEKALKGLREKFEE